MGTTSATPSAASSGAIPIEMKKGTELKGRYVVSEHIGTGGYASVWRATDKELNRDVAIKRLLRDHWRGASPEEVHKVLEEGRNAAKLKGHRNIVEVYEVLEDSGEAFLVMEYVDGPSLDGIFKEHALKGDWVPVNEALDYLNQILEGLVFAHSSGLIHRDIKPSNILVSKLGVAKLADFGIAKPMPFARAAAARPEQGFAATGSQSFMSFEQSRGEELDQQTDIFSAGIVAYMLLTGRHPFNHPSAAFSIFDLIREPGYSCQEIAPRADLPESARRAVMKMLAKERSQRYHSAYEPLSAVTIGKCKGLPRVCDPERRWVQLLQPVRLPAPDERKGDWEGAIKLYEQALRADKNYSRAFSNLGYALNRLGKYDEAIHVLTEGIRVTNDSNILHRLYDARGFAKSNLKRFGDAISDFTDALDLNMRNPRVYYHRAESAAQLGLVQDAYKDVFTALDLDPDFPGALRLKERLDAGRFGYGA